MISIDPQEHFIIVPADEEILEFIAPMKKLRGGMILDQALAEPWTCDPARCRPLMGRNLCCKVDTRCVHLKNGLCAIHEKKPFSCALFPIDLWRVGRARVLLSAKNPLPYSMGWSRYDRDMLRCFEGEIPEGPSMVDMQLPVLEKVFTRAELAVITDAVREIREGGL